MTLSLYAPALTPRLRYAASLLLEQLLGLSVNYFTDLATWQNAPLPRLHYDIHPPPPTAPPHLHLPASGLLHERDIRRKAIQWDTHHGLPVCFKAETSTPLPYDALAMTFYFVTRYEEYFDTPRDIHDRYPAASSALYPHLHRPLLHEVAQQVGQALQHLHPPLAYRLPPYRFQPTYDIDYAWAYLHKGATRALGGLARDLAAARWSQVGQRWRVWLDQSPDPYYTFPLLRDWHEAHGLSPLYFWLVGKHGPHDKNISLHQPAFQALIRSLSANAATGWHPSYATYDAPLATLRAEKSSLESLLQRSITQSRQHYLRLRLPDTYRRLIDVGITDEYSMGYAEAIGFRAGIAIPYLWYDLHAEAVTPLRIHPFAVMDVTLHHYLRLSPTAACTRIDDLVQRLRHAGGTFTSLWHNNSLAEQDGWSGWREVYAHLLAVAQE